MPYYSPHTPSQYLALILDGLRKAAAARAGRQWSFAPVNLILWGYLHRVAARFEAHCARLQKGFAPRASAPRASKPDPAPTDPRKTPRTPRLSRKFGWLAALGPDIAVYGSQLRHLLSDPDVRALIDTSPQAARILRPLCRMLRIEPAPDLPTTLYPAQPTRRPTKRPTKPRQARVARRPVSTTPSPAGTRPRCDPDDWWMPKRA